MATAIKVETVEELARKLGNAKGVVLADFTGLNVENITQLRRNCRASETEFVVVKNTLARLAVKEAGLDGLEAYLQGPTGWAITRADSVTPAKVLSDFAKEHKLPKIKGGYIDGNALSPDQVERIAELPTKPVLIAQILGLIQSPVQGLAGGLHAVMTGLAIAVEEIRKQKETGGGPAVSDEGAESAKEETETKAEEAPEVGGEKPAEPEADTGSEETEKKE